MLFLLSTEMEALTIRTQLFSGRLDPSAIKTLIVSSLDNDKAFDIETIDLQDKSALADYMIVASGTSSKQVAAMADKLRAKLEAQGCKGIKIEGLNEANWVVLDAGDVIVHLFRPEVRDFYQIEKMWSVPILKAAEEMRTA